MALLASLSYIGYGILEAKGLVTPIAIGTITETSLSSGVLQTYMHVSLFFLVGAIGGYIAERTQQKGRELQSAETELKQLKVDTDNILKHMSSGVLVIDSTGKVLTINPTAEVILQVRREDIEAMDAESVIQSLMPEFADELLSALGSDEVKLRHEITVKQPGGRETPIGISMSLLKDDGDKNRGVIAVFQDLTEVRDMQERVRKADRLAAIGELSAGIAHEIRNPLASISGSIEMLYNELKLSGEDKHLMELIMKESDRLDRIISDFLEFARMRPRSRDNVVISQLIDDLLILLNANATLSSIRTEVLHRTKNVVGRFDEEQMKQVLINLAINACEAMSNKGKLAIETSVDKDRWLKIVFRDEGGGISREARSRLFEPFFTTKEGGTGLGLAIANKIVEAHGGRIEVVSSEGSGAEFAVLLPPSVVVKGAINLETLNVGS